VRVAAVVAAEGWAAHHVHALSAARRA
jgi:hypothetical protein